jgi:putative CocE/NonD family hydrolase
VAKQRVRIGSTPKHELVVMKDVEVPMRDGARLVADVFRPRGGGRYPVIMNLGAYQKDKLWVPPADLEEPANEYMNWETVNPLWWVPRGYVCMRVDSRGTGKSHGETDPFSLQEAIDFHDSIEWAARQQWSSGAVGLAGISYYAMTQWLVANLRPPSLKAIIPWEGAADMYRDFAYHGGLFCMGFVMNWWNHHSAHHLLGRPYTRNPDTFRQNWVREYMRNSLDGAHWYRGRQPLWENIDVPLFSAGNWSGFGLHLRGNTEGYLRAASKHKRLRIHAGTHYHPFYAEEARIQQLRFLDHWLKGIDTGFMDEPRVDLLIRRGAHDNVWRREHEWPLARTRWTKHYLAPAARGAEVEGALAREAPRAPARLSYPAYGMSHAGRASASWTSTALPGSLPRMGVSFDSAPMTEDMEYTGPVALKLFVSSSTEDMDIHATIRNIGPDGNDLWEVGQQGQPVPVAKGWLRASHRKLDPARTLPWRPYHAHDERRWLAKGEVAECDVEIWPTSMVFRKGHRLRLDIQPRDGAGSAPYTHYSADYNTGDNMIHLGGSRASYLLLPLIPAAK